MINHNEPLHETWMSDAACVGYPVTWWFPETSKDYDHPDTIEATRICKTCPVRHKCLQWALKHTDQHGIYAGLTPQQRREVRRRNPALGGNK
jgi:WhiB family transcriptional regulator, redox-sensing transcriptional regulator